MLVGLAPSHQPASLAVAPSHQPAPLAVASRLLPAVQPGTTAQELVQAETT